MLDEHVRAGRVTLKLGSDVDGLIIEDGIVCGLKAGGESFRGRNIVLATGGYGANPDLFARLHRGATLWPGRSEEHTSELQSLMRISYAVFCLNKKKKLTTIQRDRKRARYTKKTTV